jgi:HPt (histidine-containing phosphotransfer) domain-containing protein
MEAAPPAIDTAVLDELEHSIGDDRQFLRDLVETYLDDAPMQLATMRDGISVGSVERVNRAAHTLKSNSASVGANGLSAMCRELETLTSPATTESADLMTPEVDTLIDAITAELERATSELNALVPAPQP